MAGRGRPSIEDKRDNQYRVRLNNEEEKILTYCSQTTGKPKSQIFRKALEEYYNIVQLNELKRKRDLKDMDMIDLGGISMKRVIGCPHCGHSNMIDLEEYGISSSSTERPMGPDVLHEFSCAEYECHGCGKQFRITGYISEYPLGAYEHEEINVEAIQREEEMR